MKTQVIIAICTSLLILSCNKEKKVESLSNEQEKVSYAIGLSFEDNLARMEETMPLDESPSVDDYIKGIQSVMNSTEGKSASYMQGVAAGAQIQTYLNQIGASDKIDKNIMYGAIRAKFNKDSLLIPEDSVGSVIQAYFKPFNEEMQNKQNENRQKRLDKKKEENTKTSEAFLNENKSKPNVKTTASGLQYKVIKEGEGASPTDADKVQVIYTGKLTDGTEFDSSNGSPISNNVDNFVPGFTEALKLMKKGGKYELYIPANLAYGDQAPPKIGPNQALVFDVELVGFEPISAEELKQIEEQKKRQAEMQQKQMQQMLQQQAAQQGQGN